MLGHTRFGNRKISAPIIPQLSHRATNSKSSFTQSPSKIDERKMHLQSHMNKVSEAYITPPRTRPTPSPKPNKRLSVRTYSASTKTSQRTITNTGISTETTPKKRVVSREYLKTTSTPKKLKMIGINLKDMRKSQEKDPNPAKASSRTKIIPAEYKSSVETFADKNDRYSHLASDSVFQSSLRMENWKEMVQQIKQGKKPMEYSIEFEKYPSMSANEFMDTIAQESKLLKNTKKYHMYAPQQQPQSLLLRQTSPIPKKLNKRDSEPAVSRTPVRVQTEYNLNDSKQSVRTGSSSGHRPDMSKEHLIQIDVPKRPNSRPSSVRPGMSRKGSRKGDELMDSRLVLESPKSERQPYVISRARIRTPDKMDFKADFGDSVHMEKAKEYSKESETLKQTLHQEIDELTEKIKAQMNVPSYRKEF